MVLIWNFQKFARDAPASSKTPDENYDIVGYFLMDERKKTVLTFFLIVSAIVVVADQVTKFLVSEFIPLNTSETVVPGFLNLVHVRNSGAAFGVFSDKGNLISRAILSAISFFALLGIFWIVISQHLDRNAVIGFALFFGGAAGNFLDRIIVGEVTDFVDIQVLGLHWPAFNVADSALTIGAIIFCFKLLFATREST
ncbi:MAG: signal peptidase II [Pseudomonadota bacterium]